MDTEILRRMERIESKLDRILEFLGLLDDELGEDEIKELKRISEKMKKGEKVPLEDLL